MTCNPSNGAIYKIIGVCENTALELSIEQTELWFDEFESSINPIITPMKENKIMKIPKITNYTYTEEKAINKTNNTYYDVMKTTITFEDGKVATTICPTESANQYTGFYATVAKYAMGNNSTINNQADYWIEKKPIKDKKREEKINKLLEEATNKAAKEKRKLERQEREMEARKLAEQYEIQKLANKLYGVPLDFVSKD